MYHLEIYPNSMNSLTTILEYLNKLLVIINKIFSDYINKSSRVPPCFTWNQYSSMFYVVAEILHVEYLMDVILALRNNNNA